MIYHLVLSLFHIGFIVIFNNHFLTQYSKVLQFINPIHYMLNKIIFLNRIKYNFNLPIGFNNL